MSRRRNNHGLAILTALFVVLTLYVLVTITVAQAQVNLHVTRQAHLKVQAHFLSQAAVQLCLKNLNDIPGYQQAHLGEVNADHPDLGEGKVTVWLEPLDPLDPAKPTPQRLRVKAKVELGGMGGVVGRSSAVVKKQRPVNEAIYARKPVANVVGNKPDGLYRRLGSDASAPWENLIPSPCNYWTDLPQDGGVIATLYASDGVNPKYMNQLHQVEGDADGNLYGIWRRRGFADEIVRFKHSAYDAHLPPAQRAAATWETLTPVPKASYDSSGNPVLGAARPDNLEGLCVGENDLFVVNEKFGIDTFTRLDLGKLEDGDPTNDWTVLPPIPKRRYSTQGDLSPANGFIGNCDNASADRQGHLFIRQRNGDGQPDTIAMWDPDPATGGGNWKYLPPAPLKYYTQENLYIVLQDGGFRKFAGNLLDLSADLDGNLYTRYQSAGIDTIYKFSAGPKPAAWARDWRIAWYQDPEIIGGSWIPLPPAPKIYYDNAGVKHEKLPRVSTFVDPATGELRRLCLAGAVAENLERGGVDKGDSFIAQWRTASNLDTLFRYHVRQRKWEAQPPVPQKRFQWDVTNILEEIDDSIFVQDFGSLGGGGVTDRTRWEYETRSHYP